MALEDAREIVDAGSNEHLGLIVIHRGDPPIYGWLMVNPKETSQIETGEELSLETAMEKATAIAIKFGITDGVEFCSHESW